eukprot:m.203722 g.203722  ORF g.203722 m.203722 type:complete len:316 (-) comp14994_c0_seq1:1853-2800(-)
MDISADECFVVAKQPANVVALHPVVILTISEHITRTKANAPQAIPRVFGALLGKQSGRELEICTTFPAIVEGFDSDSPTIDMALFDKQEASVKRNFPDYEVLGWYTEGPAPSKQTVDLHQQMLQRLDAPVLLMLDAAKAGTTESIPLTIYETTLELIAEQQVPRFVEVSYTMVSQEAERIGVEHVAFSSSATGAAETSELAKQLTGQYNAVKMLANHAATVLQYLEAVQAGAVEPDENILKMVGKLCTRLPATTATPLSSNTPSVDDDIAREMEDTTLINILASATQACHALESMQQAFSKANLQSKSAMFDNMS